MVIAKGGSKHHYILVINLVIYKDILGIAVYRATHSLNTSFKLCVALLSIFSYLFGLKQRHLLDIGYVAFVFYLFLLDICSFIFSSLTGTVCSGEESGQEDVCVSVVLYLNCCL